MFWPGILCGALAIVLVVAAIAIYAALHFTIH